MAKTEWIPCKDDLPKKDGEYLVSGKRQIGESVWICRFATMPHYRGWMCNKYDSEIKAWMPKPEPYVE